MNLLAIFAHPDDESFGPGGTLAKYAAEGHQVGLISLTQGEAGSLGISKTLRPEELGHRRSKELQCAANILGISYLKIYDLPDKNLHSLAEAKGLPIIESEIEAFHPDAIITFHENGISGHLDHKTITGWIVKKVDQMDHPPDLFFYGILAEQVEMIPQRKLFAIPEQEATHRIDVSTYVDKKIAAIACHKTQEELWKVFQELPVKYEELNRWEYFVQFQPQPPKDRATYKLFEEILISKDIGKI